MKKAQIYRRLGSLWQAVRNFFIEEEPRDKARRTMREATQSLNRIIYQRTVLEHELKSGSLDRDTRLWCEKSLELLHKSEAEMSAQMVHLRDEYRTLMMQDLYYAALNDPGGQVFEEAQAAIRELQSQVESERTIRSMPRHLPPLVLTDAGTSPNGIAAREHEPVIGGELEAIDVGHAL